MKHVLFLATLLSLSFGANAGLVDILGYQIDDTETNVFTGETVLYDADPGDPLVAEVGAMDFNSVNGVQVYACCVDGAGDSDANVIGWYDVGGNHNPTPSFIQFEIQNDDSGDSLGMLMEGNLTYLSGNDYTFDLTGGVLFDEYNFVSGILNYDASVDFSDASSDLGFTLTMTASPVPIPAAVWLFGSGLIGMVGVARRRKT